MIQIEEEKIATLMFNIWHKSNTLKNPVEVGEYIAKELAELVPKIVPLKSISFRSEDYLPTENNIVFTAGQTEMTEILKFTETEMFLYGEKVECPLDIVEGLRDFLINVGYNIPPAEPTRTKRILRKIKRGIISIFPDDI
jgi:hypothetical protein